jgi:transcriptional regulator with XRE-family HTH domain
MSKLTRDFVLLPKSEYQVLARGLSRGAVEAGPYMRASIGRGLVQARKAAGLTQGDLAKRLNVSQSMVSQAEQGKIRVGERYTASVLKASGLPEDWTPPRGNKGHVFDVFGEMFRADDKILTVLRELKASFEKSFPRARLEIAGLPSTRALRSVTLRKPARPIATTTMSKPARRAGAKSRSGGVRASHGRRAH